MRRHGRRSGRMSTIAHQRGLADPVGPGAGAVAEAIHPRARDRDATDRAGGHAAPRGPPLPRSRRRCAGGTGEGPVACGRDRPGGARGAAATPRRSAPHSCGPAEGKTSWCTTIAVRRGRGSASRSLGRRRPASSLPRAIAEVPANGLRRTPGQPTTPVASRCWPRRGRRRGRRAAGARRGGGLPDRRDGTGPRTGGGRRRRTVEWQQAPGLRPPCMGAIRRRAPARRAGRRDPGLDDARRAAGHSRRRPPRDCADGEDPVLRVPGAEGAEGPRQRRRHSAPVPRAPAIGPLRPVTTGGAGQKPGEADAAAMRPAVSGEGADGRSRGGAGDARDVGREPGPGRRERGGGRAAVRLPREQHGARGAGAGHRHDRAGNSAGSGGPDGCAVRSVKPAGIADAAPGPAARVLAGTRGGRACQGKPPRCRCLPHPAPGRLSHAAFIAGRMLQARHEGAGPADVIKISLLCHGTVVTTGKKRAIATGRRGPE